MVGSLVIVSLQSFSWFWQWKNFENRLIFDELKAYKKWCWCHFLGHPVYCTDRQNTVVLYFVPHADLTLCRFQPLEGYANLLINKIIITNIRMCACSFVRHMPNFGGFVKFCCYYSNMCCFTVFVSFRLRFIFIHHWLIRAWFLF